MGLTKTTEPYEFLVRYREGGISGAHVSFIEIVKDGEEVLHEKVIGPYPVTESGDFPLEEVLDQALLGSLKTTQDLLGQVKTLTDSVREKTGELSAARERVIKLEQKLTELEKE